MGILLYFGFTGEGREYIGPFVIYVLATGIQTLLLNIVISLLVGLLSLTAEKLEGPPNID